MELGLVSLMKETVDSYGDNNVLTSSNIEKLNKMIGLLINTKK